MLIIGIDPGISGSICFYEKGRITEILDMPTMTDGKKNKKQVNGSQVYNEINSRIKSLVDKNDINIEEEFGDILFVLVNVAKRLSIRPERSLKQANQKFKRRFIKVLELAESQNKSFNELDLDQKELLWKEVKNNENNHNKLK